MEEEYGITLLQMMENAGRALARLAADRFLDGSPVGRKVTVLAGGGGNGGGALVAARRLRGWGASVEVVLAVPPDAMKSVPRRQLETLRRLGGVEVRQGTREGPTGEGDLVLDGVLGYSIRGAPRGEAARLIHWAAARSVPVLSLDVPSGLDPTTGEVREPAVRAGATLTLALPKRGLVAPGARAWVGELYLADIGVPPELWGGMGVEVGPLFAAGDVLALPDPPGEEEGGPS